MQDIVLGIADTSHQPLVYKALGDLTDRVSSIISQVHSIEMTVDRITGKATPVPEPPLHTDSSGAGVVSQLGYDIERLLQLDNKLNELNIRLHELF